MLKKWFNKVFPNKHSKQSSLLVEYDANDFGLGLADVNFAAEKVVKRLQQHGYEAYIVGGAVRDLLLGLEPKDFDVATNASPEEIRKLFRRSRIIGRRFRIVHVMVGPETIEVTTFRGGSAHQNASGRIMKDNQYGTQKTDAIRRDFTCNALYYDPFGQIILDQHGGVQDIKEQQLVMIGDPAVRYQEDPVRIMRAIRLSTKLGFHIEEKTAKPLVEMAGNLSNEPAARLFDEVVKLLLCGQAYQCLINIEKLGLENKIHPFLTMLFEQGIEISFVRQALDNTDERVKQHKHVSIGFILASCLWPTVLKSWRSYLEQGHRESHALNLAIADIKALMEGPWGMPHKISAIMREIWQMQVQFDFRRGARAFKTLAQPRFRAAYDFLILRADNGEVDKELVQWWTDFQRADEFVQTDMLKEQNGQKKAGNNRAQAKRALKEDAEMVVEKKHSRSGRQNTRRRRNTRSHQE